MPVRAQDRAFPVFSRGEIRDAWLDVFRSELRRQANPDTGQLFTEDEIAQATTSGTNHYARASSHDLIWLETQRHAMWQADQLRIERASAQWLRDKHGRELGEDFLPASGGTGVVEFECTPGTIFVGSTEKPDPGAMYGRELKTGQVFQIFYDVTAVGTTARVVMSGLSTGPITNLVPGAEITLANPPLSVTKPGRVVERFTGGSPQETNAEFAARLLAIKRYVQGAGNNPQLRNLARRASSAVDDVFVYACALHAGTVVACVMQKRGTVKGYAARVANVATLEAAQSALVAPAAPDLPAPPFVLVVAGVPQACTTIVRASLPRGRTTGWTDAEPWPVPASGAALVGPVSTQVAFQVATSGPLPAGTRPSLMAWNTTLSEWEALKVDAVAEASPGVYDVTLREAASFTIAIGTAISPDIPRRESVGAAVVAYFDSLGPGEVVNLSTDVRAHRALRFPLPVDERPSEAGGELGDYLTETMGSALASYQLEYTGNVPEIPSDPSLGPRFVAPTVVAMYPRTS